MVVDAPPITVRPANEAAWQDLRAVFGARGPAYRCQCQRFRLGPRESFGGQAVEVRAARLREQTNAGVPAAARTSGLVAYAGVTPVGWCAVAPRPDYHGLVRVFRVPWDGRDEDRGDPTVWAVTCVLVRAGYRRRGVGRALVAAAVDHARRRGARALEGYPVDPEGAMSEELHVGTPGMFADAGLVEVHRPTKRRRVMRVDFTGPDGGDR